MPIKSSEKLIRVLITKQKLNEALKKPYSQQFISARCSVAFTRNSSFSYEVAGSHLFYLDFYPAMAETMFSISL